MGTEDYNGFFPVAFPLRVPLPPSVKMAKILLETRTDDTSPLASRDG